MSCQHSYCTETAQRGRYCPGHAEVMYQPLEADALPQERIAHALRFGISHLDGAQLRTLDTIALVTVQGLPQELSPTDHHLDRTMHDLRLAIAAEQTRRAQAWARIAAQLAGMETDPDQGQEVPDQGQEEAAQETDQDRALKLLRAALMLIMGPQGPGPNQGGGGRPVRPVPPGPRTPPNDGRALSSPGAPSSSRRGDDDDGIAF